MSYSRHCATHCPASSNMMTLIVLSMAVLPGNSIFFTHTCMPPNDPSNRVGKHASRLQTAKVDFRKRISLFTTHAQLMNLLELTRTHEFYQGCRHEAESVPRCTVHHDD